VESVRIDKWLWAARFFKTRSLASRAVAGGKVHLNNERIKPSKSVAVGDRLQIRRLEELFDVKVRALADKRGPAKVAQLLYEESAESIAAREQLRQDRRLLRQSSPAPQGRPDKRARRLIHRFKQSARDSSE
jgi:ribosome-associated heat shock protein Hsp15